MSSLARAVRSVRRRLFAHTLLGHLLTGWSLALVVALAWFLAEPLVFSTPQPRVRLWVLAGVGNVATAAAIIVAARRCPSRLDAALELDHRFDLKERATTSVGLSPEQAETPAGRAVHADAEAHVRRLRPRDRFPVRPDRRVWRLPLLGVLLAVVAFVYHPVTDSGLLAEKSREKDEASPAADIARRAQADKSPRPKPALPDRADRSKDVRDLQEELARLEANARPTDPAAAAEMVAAVTAAEEKAKALAREKADRLTRLERQFAQLGKPAGDAKDGPAKGLAEALADGDLDRAAAAADELARQLRDPAKKEQLQKQLDRLGGDLKRAAANQDKVDDLTKRIAEAKANGADTSGLEAELARAKADAGKQQDVAKLADRVQQAGKSLEDGKSDDAANQLDGVARQLDGLKGEVQDLKDLQAQQQRLGDLKGEAMGQQGGAPQGGMPDGKADAAAGNDPATGARPQGPKSPTASTDERQRTPFDGKGQRTSGGASPGGGYTRRSPADLGPVIDRAVQEAPEAAATQPLSRDDKDAVREFYRDFPKK